MVHVLWDRVFTTSHQSFRASRRRARNHLVTSRENTIPQDINHGFLFSPVILHNNEFNRDIFCVINAKNNEQLNSDLALFTQI